VHHEPVELDEAAFIEQKIEPLARGQLAFGVLRFHALRPATLLRLGDSALEELEFVA
jgi:hypothetical protein